MPCITIWLQRRNWVSNNRSGDNNVQRLLAPIYRWEWCNLLIQFNEKMLRFTTMEILLREISLAFTKY